jgi:hypothetical protein
MTQLLVNTLHLATPAPVPTGQALFEYQFYPPTPSANTPPPQPLVQLSKLGITNQGKLAGPSKPPYGAAIPSAVRVGGSFSR